MTAQVHPTSSSAAASADAPALPSLELLEARQRRDALKVLLRKEQAAMADFLVALADFDRRRGWEPLGHANLFAFLHVELRLSRSAAFYRKSAAELLQDFPEVIEPLREGRLCLSTIAELAKVLTEENRGVVMPRFFGLSAREAQELVAEFQPRQVPSTRMVVTRVLDQPVIPPPGRTQPLLAQAAASPANARPTGAPPSRVLTSDFANGGSGLPVSRRDEIVPLTSELRRVHFNVGKQVVEKLEAARDALSHSIRGATMEHVLEAALDLLLEKQAKARGLVKRPRSTLAAATTRGESSRAAAATPQETPPAASTLQVAPPIQASEESAPPRALIPTGPPARRRAGPRESIPAAVRRAVWARDAGRCCWPLDGGGTCGSTHRLELDHIRPWAQEGNSTEENLRIVCAAHNRQAARQAFGRRCVERYSGARDSGRPRRGPADGASAASCSKT